MRRGQTLQQCVAVSDGRCPRWRTPDDIPIDVTEHFRERCAASFSARTDAPRKLRGDAHNPSYVASWHLGGYQLLLIGSVFVLEEPARRPALAEALWHWARHEAPPTIATLLITGLVVAEARDLWPGHR